MKNLILVSSLLFPLLSFAGWDQPGVLCPEQILPKGIECLDLTRVKDPLNEFPSELTDAERMRWAGTQAADLKLCRHQEVLRREKERPGTFKPLQIQIAWMIANGGEKIAEKKAALLSAAQKHGMPYHVLIGAITQESLLSSLGISPDGGNYSCGIAQLNISEWCSGLAAVPASERSRVGWPAISCGALTSTMLTPFYAIAKTKLNGRPEYRITASDFEGITFEEIKQSLPAASEATQLLRYQAITSFIRNCQDFNLSISAKALTLRNLFVNHVPAELRNAEKYKTGESFQQKCETSYTSPYWPLHTGWLLAVGIYNAGPKQTRLVEHYHGGTLPALNPTSLVEALHWGGKVREGTNKVFFTGRDGVTSNQTWYKSCVVQRHVARVIQHVSPAGKPLVRSMEQVPCSLDEVPAYRRNSSGVKAPTDS